MSPRRPANPRRVEWDARKYDEVSDPQFQWGLEVLDRLTLRGDETVLDAGCGSGRLTAEILKRVPRGRVIAVDVSKGMLDLAREKLAPFHGERVQFIESDLTRLRLPEPVDSVFSTAVFHWVRDQDALFPAIISWLRPGGRLVAQCGATGNLESVKNRAIDLATSPTFLSDLQGARRDWTFLDRDATAERLRAAGFENGRVWVEERPTPFANRAAFRAFVSTVVLRGIIAWISDAAVRERYLEAFCDLYAADQHPFELDYVRLNIDTFRPA